MNRELKQGQRVATRFGRGTIRQVMIRHAAVQLDDNSLVLKFPISELSLVEGTTSPAPNLSPAFEPSTPRSSENGAAYTCLESLRFGLVPRSHLSQLTLGYAQLREWTREFLEAVRRPRPTLGEVHGPFGAGKSHTMAVVRHVAREDNFLVARVEVDGDRVSLGRPQTFFSALWPTLEGEGLGVARPLLDLYSQLARERGFDAPRFVDEGIDRTRDNLRAISYLIRKGCFEEHEHDLLSVLTSDGTTTASKLASRLQADPKFGFEYTFRAIVPLRVAERPVAFVNQLLDVAQMAALTGRSGLLITIDEFEVEEIRSQRRKATFSVLTHLLNTVRQVSRLRGVPLGIIFATAADHDSTSGRLIEFIRTESGGKLLELPTRHREQLLELGDTICALYALTHSLDGKTAAMPNLALEDVLDRETESGLLRAYIKALMNRLDTSFGPPHARQ